MIWTIGSILNWTKQYFTDKGVENPRLDAEVLLSHILGKDRVYLYVNFDKPLVGEELAIYREAVKKRAMRLPIAYITGVKEFMGLEFNVSKAVLIPRPDTEILVEEAIKRLQAVENPAILDLGTGSGAIIISVLKKITGAAGVAVDISGDALTVAAQNAEKHSVNERLTLQQGDLWGPVSGQVFDAVLSNPPYIVEEEIVSLQPEVKQEPRLALAGGRDGLDFYRRIIDEGHLFLKPGGFIAVEVGAGQAGPVAQHTEKSQLSVEEIIKDYAGIERVVVLRRR